jgi:hypothetical protein
MPAPHRLTRPDQQRRDEERPEPLQAAVDDALLLAWASSLAKDDSARPDVRRLAESLTFTLTRLDELRRQGRDGEAVRKASVVLVEGLRARGAEPPG